jgi:sterol desaturase/sphingolipid hydroxylase (fatty acid hydroxylase superfamily)
MASAGLSPAAPPVFLGLLAFLVFALIVERWSGRDVRRYLSPHVRMDLVYTVLVVAGLYELVYQPLVVGVDRLLRSHARFLYVRLLDGLPGAVHFAAFLVVADLARYWKHRALHAWPVLWAFHKVHHAAEELNFLTNYRLHLVEVTIDSLIIMGLVALLGAPAPVGFVLTLVLLWYQSLLHSDLDWTYGRLRGLLVSPQFHGLHHSTDPRHYDKNFGVTLVVWDRLFGTAQFDTGRPAAYGLTSGDVPRSFAGQLLTPFVAWLRLGGAPPREATVPEGARLPTRSGDQPSRWRPGSPQ